MVLTSKEAAKAVLQTYPQIKTDTICVSSKTAEFAVTKGLKVVDYAFGYGKELYEIILQKYANKKLYFPHGKVLAFDMPFYFKKAGINFKDECVYETICNENNDKITFLKGDIFIFTSPSTVECFFKNYQWQKEYYAVAIGKTTYEALPNDCKKFMAKHTTIESSIQKARSLHVN